MCLIKKRNLTLSVISAALLATSWGAQAAQDTAKLTITANVVENTCTLDTTAPAVDFKIISMRDVKSVNTELKTMPFTLKLSACQGGATGVTVTATGSANKAISDLFETNGTATGVGIKIMGGDSGTTKLTPVGSTAKYKIKSSAATADLKFTASLVQSDAKVTAGNVSSTINLNVSYD